MDSAEKNEVIFVQSRISSLDMEIMSNENCNVLKFILKSLSHTNTGNAFIFYIESNFILLYFLANLPINFFCLQNIHTRKWNTWIEDHNLSNITDSWFPNQPIDSSPHLAFTKSRCILADFVVVNSWFCNFMMVLLKH